MEIDDYFKIISIKDHVLHLEIKGFWSDDVIDEVGPEFLRLYREAVDSFKNSKFVMINDSTDFKTPTEKARQYLIEAVNYGFQHGLYKAVQIIPHSVIKLAEKMAAKKREKNDLREVVSTIDEAFQKVEEIKKELE